ncbi:MAG TPA: DNA polymerase III subunit delta [Anaerolineales bacterium]
MADAQTIHFLYGNDEYAIARRARELSSIFSDPSEAEMNTAHLEARTMTEDQWINAINALPFISTHRVVLLTDPSARFVRRKARAEQPAEPGSKAEPAAKDRSEAETAAQARAKFLQSLERMPESTLLVITEVLELRSKQDRMAAEKHWLAAWMRKNHHAVEFLAQPGGDSMAGWISREAKAQGGAFAPDAAQRLMNMVGADTRQAAQEVTKLLTYVNWKRPVTAADVDALSPLTAAPDVFKMVEALSAGNSREAQKLLHRLLEFQDVFSTWGMVVRQFRYLLVAREVLDGRGGIPETIRTLSEVEGRPVAAFAAENALKQARLFNMPRLEQIYRRLLEIDEDAKTGRMPLEVSLDLLVAELAAK